RQLILKGTATRSAAAIGHEVGKLGGVLSSKSEYDETSYSFIAPSESYQAMIELLADLIQRPALNAVDVKGAAQLALLESKREQDYVETAAMGKLFSTAFLESRLRRAGAVSDNLPASATREQVLAFYQSFYHPGNTVITVVGDVFSLQALGQ